MLCSRSSGIFIEMSREFEMSMMADSDQHIYGA